uniref:Uncharacterized protein n=1 Tax=Leersia perrieri TaxID=77586 RepID=A0A0D9XI21_9ORYZ
MGSTSAQHPVVGILYYRAFDLLQLRCLETFPRTGPVTPASPERSTPKEKPQKRERNEGKKQKGGGSGSACGFLVPLQLSDDLVKFIGTGLS